MNFDITSLIPAVMVAGVGFLLKRAIDQSDRKLEATEKKLEAIGGDTDRKLESISSDVKALMHVVGDQRGDIRVVNGDVNSMRQDIRRLWDRVDALETRLDEP